MKTYSCGFQGCSNKNNWCYVLDGIHLKVFPQHFKVWSMAINDDRCEVKDSSSDLIKTLQSVKHSQTNLMRNIIQNAKSTSTAQGPSMTSSAVMKIFIAILLRSLRFLYTSSTTFTHASPSRLKHQSGISN